MGGILVFGYVPGGLYLMNPGAGVMKHLRLPRTIKQGEDNFLPKIKLHHVCDHPIQTPN